MNSNSVKIIKIAFATAILIVLLIIFFTSNTFETPFQYAN